jgi:hypothetical protein
MQAKEDMDLLREYGSEAAFTELVSRRVGFVYSSALRQVRDPHLAEEITQGVFILLARKAGGMPAQPCSRAGCSARRASWPWPRSARPPSDVNAK